MTTVSLHRELGLEWSVAARPHPRETVSGDRHVVARSEHKLLLGVIDGLGHGEEATLAARVAADLLTARADETPVSLILACHAALRATRGAAMTVMSIDRRSRTAAALGIGNVEAMVLRADRAARPARECVLLRNGVVGYQLPRLQECVMTLAAGDLVVFATDGIREDFSESINPADPLPKLVDRILTQKFRGTDDALVLAGKILEDR